MYIFIFILNLEFPALAFKVNFKDNHITCNQALVRRIGVVVIAESYILCSVS